MKTERGNLCCCCPCLLPLPHPSLSYRKYNSGGDGESFHWGKLSKIILPLPLSTKGRRRTKPGKVQECVKSLLIFCLGDFAISSPFG
jgi:hypothetical protein